MLYDDGNLLLKFMFSKKATKIDEIFSVDLTVTTYCQIDGEDFVNFCGLLRKCELYYFPSILLCTNLDVSNIYQYSSLGSFLKLNYCS